VTAYSSIDLPSYLISIAVGNLEYRQLGRRTGVITEPEMIEKCAKELEDLEYNLAIAETYLIPYMWGEYDILILPPSFPFGGMENPLLTFASPTIIVGDKSQVNVATHEICHSWSGNWVTCADWQNYWVNEGFTVFEERKVSQAIYGHGFSMVEAQIGNRSMVEEMKSLGFDHNYTRLNPGPYNGANPDDAEGEIPYEKGYQFLRFLESLVGPYVFNDFLREYFIHFGEQSIYDSNMKDYFINFLHLRYAKDYANEINSKIDWDTWISGKGMPPVTVDLFTYDAEYPKWLAEEYLTKGNAS